MNLIKSLILTNYTICVIIIVSLIVNLGQIIMVTIIKDVKNTEGGFVRVAIGVETLNRLKQLAGSSSLAGYLSGLTQELLKGQQVELLPRLRGQISLASLKLAIDDLSAKIDNLEEIVAGVNTPHHTEDDQSNP